MEQWNVWREQNQEDLIEINLSGADLNDVDLSDANLRHADLRNVSLIDANLIDADLRGADLRGAKLHGAKLHGADLRGAKLSGTDLSGADMIGANLSDVDLSGANLRYYNLSGANLRRYNQNEFDVHIANLSEAHLNGARLRGANLHSYILSRADLRGADLSDADLSDAKLHDADLSGARLNGASLSGADLSGASLNGADLSSARLNYADLRGADLRGASLIDARLRGANLSQAIMAKTVFVNLDLRETKGLVEINHQGPSIVQLHTVLLPQDGSALHFLRGAGIPDEWINFWCTMMIHLVQYHSLFISYSSKDDLLARRLHADLQEKGVRCWFAPEDMKIGDKIRARIDEAIHLQDKLLLLLSEHALASAWVEDEVEAALEKEQRQHQEVLFPVRLDESVIQTSAAWAAKLRRTRHIGDFTHWTDPQAYQQAFELLLRDLKMKP